MTTAIDARARELRAHSEFDRMVQGLLSESKEADDLRTMQDCEGWLHDGDQLAADRCARALATDEALARECTCDVPVENRMGASGWRRGRDGLWYHVRDVCTQYTFEAARMKWMREDTTCSVHGEREENRG